MDSILANSIAPGRKGYFTNRGNKSSIQKKYRSALSDTVAGLRQIFQKKLSSVVVRGSVSVGKAHQGISDVDLVVLINGRITPSNKKQLFRLANVLERTYRFIPLFDLAVFPKRIFFNSPELAELRINVALQSVHLFGQDIVPRMPRLCPDLSLARILTNGYQKELRFLLKICSDPSANRSYRGRQKPLKFWCVWTCRCMLRYAMALTIPKSRVYSRDLKTCQALFNRSYPAYKHVVDIPLQFALHPTGSAQKICDIIKTCGRPLGQLIQKDLSK